MLFFKNNKYIVKYIVFDYQHTALQTAITEPKSTQKFPSPENYSDTEGYLYNGKTSEAPEP